MPTPKYQLAVDYVYQLTVASSIRQTQLMVAKEHIREAFARRLNLACDEASVRQRGRATDVQAFFKSRGVRVSTTAVGKWLNAQSVPEPDNLLLLAGWLQVREEWLEYGRGPMRANEVREEAPASFALATLKNLQGVATPRTLAVLDRIERAAKDGRLRESDLVLLEEIAKYLEQKNDRA